MQLQDKGHNSEKYIFGVMPPFNLNFKVEGWPQLTDEHWYRMRCSSLTNTKLYFTKVLCKCNIRAYKYITLRCPYVLIAEAQIEFLELFEMLLI